MNNTIALVDSHKIMREGLEYILLLLGYKIVLSSDNGNELMGSFEGSAIPGICILDMDMPGINGYQLTRQLKSKFPQLRILAYSTESNELAIEKILNCGADAYLEKGVTNLQELKKTIDRLHEVDFTEATNAA